MYLNVAITMPCGRTGNQLYDYVQEQMVVLLPKHV